jgi:hypothetical protein
MTSPAPALARAVATGASGFVGRALARALPQLRAMRLGGADWAAAIAGTDLREATIFHLAARVHEPPGSGEALYEHDNASRKRARSPRPRYEKGRGGSSISARSR